MLGSHAQQSLALLEHLLSSRGWSYRKHKGLTQASLDLRPARWHQLSPSQSGSVSQKASVRYAGHAFGLQ